jgi:lysophospholipase L1-like esterase
MGAYLSCMDATAARPAVRTILCYGDSNTWGYDPLSGERLAEDVRWPGVLREALGRGYRVIEEGLSGRTTVWDDPIEGAHKNGRTYLLPCLESHKPIDLVIIMLGTNDLKARFRLSAADIAHAVDTLADVVMKSKTGPNGTDPKVLLIAPPPVEALTDLAETLEGASRKSARFAQHYERHASLLGCGFLDAGTVIRSSDLDGIHLEAEEHRKLGDAVAGAVRSILTG